MSSWQRLNPDANDKEHLFSIEFLSRFMDVILAVCMTSVYSKLTGLWL